MSYTLRSKRGGDCNNARDVSDTSSPSTVDLTLMLDDSDSDGSRFSDVDDDDDVSHHFQKEQSDSQIITSEDGRFESLKSPLVASVVGSVNQGKLLDKEFRVSVKWGLASQNEKKRSGAASSSAETFDENEKIYALVDGVRYEATVVKYRVDPVGGGTEYYVQIDAFKNSYNKWLSPENMIKRVVGMEFKVETDEDDDGEVEIISTKPVRNLRPRRKSLRTPTNNEEESEEENRRDETYAINEKIFAWDRPCLYEARVMKSKDTGDGIQYWVHYNGYKKSHERWLTSHDMMKITPKSQEFFDNMRNIKVEGHGNTGLDDSQQSVKSIGTSVAKLPSKNKRTANSLGGINCIEAPKSQYMAQDDYDAKTDEEDDQEVQVISTSKSSIVVTPTRRRSPRRRSMTSNVAGEDIKEPKVGMRVSVWFKESDTNHGGSYYGKVTRVSPHVDKDWMYIISIRYDDGETEETYFPDPDITLDPNEVSGAQPGVAGPNGGITSELLSKDEGDKGMKQSRPGDNQRAPPKRGSATANYRGNTSKQSSAQPETVKSDANSETTCYDEADYKSLQERYLMPRIRQKAELATGITLRRQCRDRLIDQKTPGFKLLKTKVDSLLKKNNHAEVYRLLCQLRDWELNPERTPAAFHDGKGDGDVEEVLDLTKEDDDPGQHCIDVDEYITDVLLVDVKKEKEGRKQSPHQPQSDLPEVTQSSNQARQVSFDDQPSGDGGSSDSSSDSTEASRELVIDDGPAGEDIEPLAQHIDQVHMTNAAIEELDTYVNQTIANIGQLADSANGIQADVVLSSVCHGRTASVHENSDKTGCKPGMQNQVTPMVLFGHPMKVLEGMLCSRRYLYSNDAHRAATRGINGNLNDGADSIVVSRQCPKMREGDGLSWLRYTSSRSQGGGALCVSRRQELPVRVFRSSKLTSEYAPPELEGGRTSYRYDGLYMVTRIWDEDGNSLDGDNVMVPSGGCQYTFNLFRIPHDKTTSVGPSPSTECNAMSIDQLWLTIQTSHGRQPSQFLPVRPQSIGTLPKLANDVVTKKRATNAVDNTTVSEKPGEVRWDDIPKPPGQLTIDECRNFYAGKKGPYAVTKASCQKDVKKSTEAPAGGELEQNTRKHINWDDIEKPPGQRTIHECHNFIVKGTPRLKPRAVHLREKQEIECDFTNQKAIMTTFRYHRGKGKLVPLLSEIAKYKTNEEKAQYIRWWRKMTKEEQENERATKRERRKFECDFTKQESIKASFPLKKGKGQLRPLLPEIAKLESRLEKVQYVRRWRDMTKEEQTQYKKERKEENDAKTSPEKVKTHSVSEMKETQSTKKEPTQELCMQAHSATNQSQVNSFEPRFRVQDISMSRNYRTKAESSMQNSAARSALLYQSRYFSRPTSNYNQCMASIGGTHPSFNHSNFLPGKPQPQSLQYTGRQYPLPRSQQPSNGSSDSNWASTARNNLGLLSDGAMINSLAANTVTAAISNHHQRLTTTGLGFNLLSTQTDAALALAKMALQSSINSQIQISTVLPQRATQNQVQQLATKVEANVDHVSLTPHKKLLTPASAKKEYKTPARLVSPEVPTETNLVPAGKKNGCRKRKVGQLTNLNKHLVKKVCLGEGKTRCFSVSAFGFPSTKSLVDVGDIDKRFSQSFKDSKVKVKLHQRSPAQYRSAPKHPRLQYVKPKTNTIAKSSIIPQHRLVRANKNKYTRSTLHKDWKKQLQRRRHGQWIPSGHLNGRWKAPQWAVKGECIPMQTKVASCKKSLLPRLDNLVLTFMVNAEVKLDPSCEVSPSETLCDVKCPAYTKPTFELLRHAHTTVQNLLPKGDCEEWEVIELARKYYQYWRPKKTRIILLAESHAHTTTGRALNGPGICKDILSDSYFGPRQFISHVYCLGYGENEALTGQANDTDNKGSSQFWALFAACARGVEHVAATKSNKTVVSTFAADLLKGGDLPVEQRMEAKLEVLENLRRRGVWLLDASIFGWYISQPQQYSRSSVSNEVHRRPKTRPPKELKTPSLVLSWELFTKHVIREVANEGNLKLLIPIGMEVETALTRKRMEDAIKGNSKGARVSEPFPAPNAWIPGGYGPFHAKLAALVNENAPLR